jgi:hypothetical protein
VKGGVEAFMETLLLGRGQFRVLRSRGASMTSPISSIEEIGIELGDGSV